MVALGAVLDEHQRAASALDDIGARGIGREARHDDVAAVAGVVDEQPVVGLEVRIERQPEETALAAVLDLAGDVHEEAGLEDPTLDHPDRPALLDDE